MFAFLNLYIFKYLFFFNYNLLEAKFQYQTQMLAELQK